MKWIKLFEGFNQHEKINFVNDKFFYFKIRKKLNAMKLRKIDARKYIYFYTKSSSLSSNLKFVFSKEDNQLSYHMFINVSKDFGLEERGGIKYRLSNYNLNKIRSIFEELLKDHLSYINVDFRVSEINSVYWAELQRKFQKIKEGIT